MGRVLKYSPGRRCVPRSEAVLSISFHKGEKKVSTFWASMYWELVDKGSRSLAFTSSASRFIESLTVPRDWSTACAGLIMF